MITISVGKIVAIALSSFALGVSLMNLIWCFIMAHNTIRQANRLDKMVNKLFQDGVEKTSEREKESRYSNNESNNADSF